jgi:hypothetical protein
MALRIKYSLYTLLALVAFVLALGAPTRWH